MNDFLSTEDPGIDLTPVIDVVFLLLIFFIMATTFSTPVLEVILAEAESSTVREEQKERLALSIDAKGALYHDTKLVSKEEWTELVQAINKDTVIVFNVDKDAPFEAFIGSLDVVKAKGHENVLINTAKSSTPPSPAADSAQTTGNAAGKTSE